MMERHETRSEERGEGRAFEAFFDLGNLRSGEWWLSRVGIGLLLLGVAFLYKYSEDQGWISDPMRVAFSLSLGVGMLAFGLKIYEARRPVSQVILGGGLGTLYITAYGAYGAYSLVSWGAAFVFMAAVTALAFFLSLRQNEAILALIATAGGLATPFVLYTEDGSLGGLTAYTCIILAGAAAVYLHKGWASLVLTAFAGTWAVFLAGGMEFRCAEASCAGAQWALQAGEAFTWLVFWLVPTARELLRSRDPERWSLPGAGIVVRTLLGSYEEDVRGRVLAHSLAVATPLVALAWSWGIWEMEPRSLGLVALAGAAVYALGWFVVRRFEEEGHLSYTHALVAMLLGVVGFVLVLEGDAFLISLAGAATVIHFVAKRMSDVVVRALGHALFAIAAMWLAGRLAFDAIFAVPEATMFLNVRAMSDLAVIMLAVVATFSFSSSNARIVYRVAAHVALLAWLWCELSPLANGEAYATISWGTYATLVLIAGLRTGRVWLVRGGLATLFLVAAKLLVVDLAEVEAVWRILLFLGFGGTFLALGFFLQSLWKPGERSRERLGA